MISSRHLTSLAGSIYQGLLRHPYFILRRHVHTGVTTYHPARMSNSRVPYQICLLLLFWLSLEALRVLAQQHQNTSSSTDITPFDQLFGRQTLPQGDCSKSIPCPIDACCNGEKVSLFFCSARAGYMLLTVWTSSSTVWLRPQRPLRAQMRFKVQRKGRVWEICRPAGPEVPSQCLLQRTWLLRHDRGV